MAESRYARTSTIISVLALAYRFDTADGSVVFCGDTSANEDLIALTEDADILVHQVADLSYPA